MQITKAPKRGLTRTIPMTLLALLLSGSLTSVEVLAESPARSGNLNSSTATTGTVAGFVENAWFDDNKIAFPAKLDTGANSSSINVPRYKTFKRDSQDWVRIDINNRVGQQLVLEVPIDRYVTIRRAGTRKTQRPIVKLTICVGGQTANTEFTLADRTGQSYQILVGRKFMEGRLLVDSGAQNLLKGRCRAGAENS
ncbi:MAG: ATP-dependent zinc protease family protein [Burkholderiaceae bacterium]